MDDRKRIAEFLRIQPDPRTIARVVELGRKADEGTLTDAETHEYELLVDIGDLVATLKAKVRRYLKENPD